MPSTKVTVNNNGPIRIEGDFSVHDAAGKEFGLGGRSIISLCRCGQSKNMPFCDGSHRGTGFAPMTYVATESKTVYFCGCKHTANPCMCDGTHAGL